MAKIILDVVTQSKNAKKEIDSLKASIKSISKVNYDNEIREEKLAQAKAKTTKAIAEEMRATNRANEAFYKSTKAKNDDTRAQEKHNVKMKEAALRMEKAAKRTKEAADATKKHSQTISSMIPNIIKWQVAMTAVMLPLRKLQDGLESINKTLVETEKRVVALQRVAGGSANAKDLYTMAQQYGQTFENVADAVERFAKSGYTWEESLKAAETALVAMNVAELDAEQATEGLIAVVKQYGFELEKLNYIQGVLNKTADNAAVTTEELLIALQKTGSTASNANVSFEETVALITALSEGTAASGQNIGNALRSLFVFTSDKKALETFASLSESMNETVRLYQAGGTSILNVWKGLAKEIEKMENGKGTLSSIFGGVDLDSDIATELTKVEDQLAEIYGTAGNYRQNYFISLMNNMDTVEKAMGNLHDVETYSQEENLKYLDTYESKQNELQAKWQELANDEQGWLAFKKGMAEAGIEALEFVDAVGGIGPVLLTIGGFSGFKIMQKQLASLNITLSTTQMLFGAITVALPLIIGYVNNLAEAEHEANKETISSWKANQKKSEELEKLLEKYETLDKTTNEYKEVESGIVQLLGEKSGILQVLTKDTDSYRNAVKKLAEAEKEAYRQEVARAYGAASSELANYSVDKSGLWSSGVGSFSDRDESSFGLISGILQNAGLAETVTVEHHSSGNSYRKSQILGLSTDQSVDAQLNNYRILKRAYQALTNSVDSYSAAGDIDSAKAIINSVTYKNIAGALADANDYVNDYVSSSTAQFLNMYESENGKVDTLDEAKSAYYYIRDNGNLGGFGDEIWQNLLSFVSIKENGSGAGGTSSSSSRTDKTEQINLEKSRLSVLQAQDASVGNQINALAGINALLDEQILYLQETGADETEINKLLVEKANNQKEINKLQEEYLNLTHQTKGDYYSSRVDVKRAELDSLRAGGASTSVIVSKLQEINEWNVKNLNWLKANGGSYEDILKAETEILNTQKEIDQTLKDETISILEEIRDTNKESYEYEEKKKAVLEAEKALLDAQSNRMTKIYNAETGSFEFVANEKDVQKAREDLEARRLEIEESAYNEIIALLESGEKSEAKIAEILSKWGAAYGSATPSFVTTIANALGIPTPSILSSLLSPSSNATVTSFSQSLGLLFGGSKSLSTPSSPIISGSSSHVSHDSSYTVNGVPIPVSMAEQYTIKELFEAMQLV